MVATRHEFLSEVHKFLKPKRYLEIGVQYGKSLNLAEFSEIAVGVDPHPLCQSHGNQQILSVTSDDFFTYYMAPENWFDFVFIDGSHLFEDALRDFMNAEQHSHSRTVVIFDDVLPYTQEMTARTVQPGHWTGDVWKVHEILTRWRADLRCRFVDTSPTGTMVVWNLNPGNSILPTMYPDIVDHYLTKSIVPEHIIHRIEAVTPELVIDELRHWMGEDVDN